MCTMIDDMAQNALVLAEWAIEQWKRRLVRLVTSHFPGPLLPALKGVHCRFARLRDPTIV